MKLSDLNQETLDHLVERAELLDETPLAQLSNEQARFALGRICRGAVPGEAVDLASRFFALSADERASALAKERAGVPLREAIACVISQTAANRAAGK